MKIFILPVSPEFQPSVPHFYPAHADGHGVEQDMLEWLKDHPEYCTKDPELADWHYLPIFWTAYTVRSQTPEALGRLQKEADKRILLPKKTFTTCQHARGTQVSLDGRVIVFRSAPPDETYMACIPLLCKRLEISAWERAVLKKKYRASFCGRLWTSPLRSEMAENLLGQRNILVTEALVPTAPYARMLYQSHVALAPRGVGTNSFRFYEAMQLGVVPMLVSHDDTRPFKDYIPWEECSLFSAPGKVVEMLSQYSDSQLREMGKKAREIYDSLLDFGKWPELVLRELEKLRPAKQQYYTNDDRISFIIPAYNCEDFLEEAVNSIMSDNFTEGDEIVIVDDASTDNTLNVMKRLAAKYTSIKIFSNSVNMNSGFTRNKAILEIKNRLIFNLDADNILEKGSIQQLKNLLIEKQCDVTFFAIQRRFRIGKFPHEYEEAPCVSPNKDGKFTKDDFLKHNAVPIGGGNYLFTRDSWQKAGGYPDVPIRETWGFGARQLMSGSVMHTFPGSYYYHRFGFESKYIRAMKPGLVSLWVFSLLIPFYHKIYPYDIRYMMGRNRLSWYANLWKRPIRFKATGKSKISYWGENVRYLYHDIFSPMPIAALYWRILGKCKQLLKPFLLPILRRLGLYKK